MQFHHYYPPVSEQAPNSGCFGLDRFGRFIGLPDNKKNHAAAAAKINKIARLLINQVCFSVLSFQLPEQPLPLSLTQARESPSVPLLLAQIRILSAQMLQGSAVFGS